MVLNILNKVLPVGEKIDADDIERCHPVGKANRKGNKQVIVKFRAYKIKAKVYDARFRLKNVYMSEDLTKSNQAIASMLLKHKKDKKVYKYWSIDAKFYAKAHVLQPSMRIKSASDVTDMIHDALDRGLLLDYDTDTDSESDTDTVDPMGMAAWSPGTTPGAASMD